MVIASIVGEGADNGGDNSQGQPMDAALDALTRQLRQFAEQRNWEQFHSPKNLAAALSVEAAELLEHFQWLTEEQSRNLDAAQKEAVGQEVADVLLYLLQLADKLGLDVAQEAQKKLGLNAVKYPPPSAA
jgi:NTP pyrophosphatase (non-canonical NTP hydrolase)